MVVHICNAVDIETSFATLVTISSHVEPANKPLLDILRHLFEPVFFHFLHCLSILVGIFDQLIQYRMEIRLVFDVKNAPGDARRNNSVDLCVPLYTGQISHEISKFAESLCLFKAQFGKPCAKHLDRIVPLRESLLNEGYDLVPLLSVHDLSNSMPQCLIFIDFHLTDRLNIGLFVPLGELISVKPAVVKLFDKEERSLMEISLIIKHFFLLSLFAGRALHQMH